jgi:hypothetical protein
MGPVNGLPGQRCAYAALTAVTLALVTAALAGPAKGSSGDSTSQAAQEPPAVVPDSAPVAPDPAPIAPDPAPSPPDSASPTGPESPASAAPQQTVEAQPAPTPVPAAAADATRTHAAPRDAAGHRSSKDNRGQARSRFRITAPTSLVSGFDSGGHGRELTRVGLALLALVLLSGAFLRSIAPLVRDRELQRR